jgi:hypothetical protein
MHPVEFTAYYFFRSNRYLTGVGRGLHMSEHSVEAHSFGGRHVTGQHLLVQQRQVGLIVAIIAHGRILHVSGGQFGDTGYDGQNLHHIVQLQSALIVVHLYITVKCVVIS